jgi:hypothetical protein
MKHPFPEDYITYEIIYFNQRPYYAIKTMEFLSCILID